MNKIKPIVIKINKETIQELSQAVKAIHSFNISPDGVEAITSAFKKITNFRVSSASITPPQLATKHQSNRSNTKTPHNIRCSDQF